MGLAETLDMKPEEVLERVTTLEVVQKALMVSRDDHEARIRYLERVITIGFGGLGLLQFLAPYAKQILVNLNAH